MGWAREAPREEPQASSAITRDPELIELEDVPAAVVCARCGSADCLGECSEEHTHASKVVAIVPWERPAGSWVVRLWATARLATVNHASFFSSLPGGDLVAAVRFAVLAEILAVTSHLVALGGLIAALFPHLPSQVVGDPQLLSLVARSACAAVFGLTVLMVLLHGLHGLALDVAAARVGGTKRLGLRFGLYSCGWDLATLPLGLLLLAATAGPRVAIRALPYGLTLPPRAALAYLQGVHRLDDHQALKAGRISAAITGAMALVACGVVALATALVWF